MLKKLSKYSSYKTRNKALEKNLNLNLKSTLKSFQDASQIQAVHCENLIGATSLPLGVAGPINVDLQEASTNPSGLRSKTKKTYVPLATSEGALVASVSRGFKALNLAKELEVESTQAGTTRGPVFQVESLNQAQKFVSWLDSEYAKGSLGVVASANSKYLKLLKLESRILGTQIFVRFYYDTGQAMGMNMATIATQSLVDYISQKLSWATCLAVSGNFCVDKKPSWQNFINLRGQQVWARSVINNRSFKKIFRVETASFFETWMAKCMHGSIMSGALGFNSHFANIVAAFFLATGQDPAQIVEGSHGLTTCQILNNKDIEVGIYMPAVMLGMVGGGTKLSTQKEAIALTKVKNTREMCMLLGLTVLAGELSLMASLAEGGLSRSHQRLGR
jgi:hydroxymethylglutaryl-CoA reductase (NADPH)